MYLVSVLYHTIRRSDEHKLSRELTTLLAAPLIFLPSLKRFDLCLNLPRSAKCYG